MQDEAKKICPRAALSKVLKRLGADAEFKFGDDAAQEQIARLAEDMLERAIEFGALTASTRQSGWYEVRWPPVLELSRAGLRCAAALGAAYEPRAWAVLVHHARV